MINWYSTGCQDNIIGKILFLTNDTGTAGFTPANKIITWTAILVICKT